MRRALPLAWFAVAAVGKAKRTAGGIVWNAVHGFSSGIDHADWVICGGHIYEDGKAPEGCFALIPTKDVEIIAQCKSGARSGKAQDFLKSVGISNVKNLTGGILAWIDQVDPSQPKY